MTNASVSGGNTDRINAASMWQSFRESLFQTSDAQQRSNENEKSNGKSKRVAKQATQTQRPSPSSDGSTLLHLQHFLPPSTLEELEAQEQSLPDRWLDFFCIVGIDPDGPLVDEKPPVQGRTKGSDHRGSNRPVLLDRYPRDEYADTEFPEHLPTFCFPDGGCHPLRHKIRRDHGSATESRAVDNNTAESPPGLLLDCVGQGAASASDSHTTDTTAKHKHPIVRYHHNVPEPSLCSMVLTTGAGNRLYCTSLTVYEVRKDIPNQPDKPQRVPSNKKDNEPKATTPEIDLDKNWWEEPSIDSMSKHIEEQRKRQGGSSSSSGSNIANETETNHTDEYYWVVPKCLVMISHHPFFRAQSLILRELFYTVQSGSSPVPFERYVAHLVDDIPMPRSGVGRFPRSKNTVVEWRSWLYPANCVRPPRNTPPLLRLKRPPPNRLPPLGGGSVEPLFRTLSLSNVLVVWATLLSEGKVVLACESSSAALLAPIAEALLALLFPLRWQGIYVPVLPNHDTVVDILEAPVPYLIGLVSPSTPQERTRLRHPSGVLWCDLDHDSLHLGFQDDHQACFHGGVADEEIPLLPELPGKASMRLKTELEEIADPWFLPTVEGIKGRITVGDGTLELDNSLRQPYSQKTRVGSGDAPAPTPRKYILTQSSKIPPRGKAVRYEDFVAVPTKKPKRKGAVGSTSLSGTHKTDEEEDSLWSQLEGIQIPCGEDPVTTNNTTTTTKEGTKEAIDSEGNQKSNSEGSSTTRSNTNLRTDSATPASHDSGFFLSLKRQSRSVQAHVDRAMAVFGQDFATPSSYARSQQFGEDVLGQQDEIAANFFFGDEETKRITERVRESFLRFFLVTFERYDFFVDPKTNRLNADRFVRSLNLSVPQQEYVRKVVTSQMFEIFLHDKDSIQHRRLFDEYVLKYKNGTFGLNTNDQANPNNQPTASRTPLLDSRQWQKPRAISPVQPCSIGMREGVAYCRDRRFPDRLNPKECVTKKTVSYWKVFLDSALCHVCSICA